ncbi:Synaptobrevin like protein [Aduncisulcus paluster]|uniref:Synaptobrevin like protein n=1 Tax=Aduncisulcus paluster TaxID=2918883 RepID=A0ABQ5KXV3_9EUKA|nr:Synaptobrevin like protein [Aduncisulcus paluster]
MDHSTSSEPQLISISLYLRVDSVAHKLAAHTQCSGPAKIIFKSRVEELAIFSSRSVAEKIRPSGRTSMNYREFSIHVSRLPSNLVTCLITTQDYPMRAAHSLISTIQSAWMKKAKPTWKLASCDKKGDYGFSKDLKEFMKFGQNPRKVDKIYIIQDELDETKKIMVENLDHVFKRQESLEDLILRSKDLSDSAKRFALESHDLTPRCPCSIL